MREKEVLSHETAEMDDGIWVWAVLNETLHRHYMQVQRELGNLRKGLLGLDGLDMGQDESN